MEGPSCIVLVIHLMAVLVEFGVKQLHRLFKRLHLLFHRGIRFQVVFGRTEFLEQVLDTEVVELVPVQNDDHICLVDTAYIW